MDLVKSFLEVQYTDFVLDKSQNFKLRMSGAFQLRTRETHDTNVETAQENESVRCGIKKQCVLTEHLSHLHISTGYPPDNVLLFEGVNPSELAHCIKLLISRKSLDILIALIQAFPYK